MLWQKIKKILQKEGGKCIIVEENQPSYIVMKLEDYERMSSDSQTSEIEKVNRDIDQWQAEEREKEQVADIDMEEVKVEDLPF